MNVCCSVIEARHIIRTAIAVSVLGHMVLVAGFYFSDVRQFVPVQAVSVEIVTPDQIPVEPDKTAPPEPPPEQEVPKQEAAKPEPEFRLPELSPVEREQTAAKPQQAPAEPAAQQQPPPVPDKPASLPAQQKDTAPSEPAQAQPAEPPSPWLPQLPGAQSQQTASQASQGQSPQQPAQQAADTPGAPEPDVTVKYGVVLGLPDGDGGSIALQKADIAALDIAAFKRHLKTCARLPASVAAGDEVKIVLRVLMSPNGRLRGEPEVMEARNSRKAPALIRAATDALKACQPYTMLPVEKYAEWKMLDLVFTPGEFSGG